MSYKFPKSKFIKMPFEVSLANQVNDNCTISFGDRTATKFVASDEFTKFADNDYSEFLKDSQKNADAASKFRINQTQDASTQTTPFIEVTREPDRTAEVEE